MEMGWKLFSATGCLRCQVVKTFLIENNIEFKEIDYRNEDGKVFSEFYRDNRNSIHRGPEGIEFPLLWDGSRVVQGLGEILAWLQAGDGLRGFVTRSGLLHGWIDGLSVSNGSPDRAEDFLVVLRHLKSGGIKIELSTDGANPSILSACQREGLADRVVMDLKGPAGVYRDLDLSGDDVEKTLRLLSGFPSYTIKTRVGPVARSGGEVSLLSPDEVGSAASWVAEVTNERKHPFMLSAFDPAQIEDETLQGHEALPSNALLKYRTAARRYLVKAEIEK